MSQNQLDMMELDKIMASTESDAFTEEQNNADENFAILDKELKEILIPYPETHKYATASDYEENSKIQWEKKDNGFSINEINEIKKYCNAYNLYNGHLRVRDNDYFITEDIDLASRPLDATSAIINADDNYFSDIVSIWRALKDDPTLELSRNITLNGRKVIDVDIVLDKSNTIFSEISDGYLRKALLRNKNQANIKSIIQTIQKKQNDIRSLHKDRSFIVQGCAGSGKTMVLLHRIRYLLFNKYIGQDDYTFLVPSNGFKQFVERAAKTDFNIDRSNIIPYKEYYQSLCSSKRITDHFDTNELVFPEEYLETVYSKRFIQKCYKKFFDAFEAQTNACIEICEKQLNDIEFEERFVAEQEIENFEKAALTYTGFVIHPIAKHLEVGIPQNMDDIALIVERLTKLYEDQKNKYDTVSNYDEDIFISADDERILSNPGVSQLMEKIKTEEAAIKTASIFTAGAHRNKLKRLQSDFEKECGKIKVSLIEEEKVKRAEEAKALSMVFEGVTLSSLGEIASELESSYKETVAKIEETKKKLEGTTQYLEYKYSKEIEALNDIIEFSGSISSETESFIDNLSPCYELIFNKIVQGKTIIDGLFNNLSKKESENIRDRANFFCQESENKIYNSINTALFNICRKELKSEFGINTSNIYKHHWFLSLYCKYLTRPLKIRKMSYLFMDEAQDLNASEIDLINKINISTKRVGLREINSAPTLNLFGDTKQMITKHGIDDWDSIADLVPTVYTLDENFRNTNQIIKYCNDNLSFTMKSVGVDVDEVGIYNDFSTVFYKYQSIFNSPVFIVKDDYALADLKDLLDGYGIEDYQAFTVKSVKGLEFKEIFVFDSGMTENEKYISYTRALAKLNIIQSLPQIADRSESLYIQGDDDDIEGE